MKRRFDLGSALDTGFSLSIIGAIIAFASGLFPTVFDAFLAQPPEYSSCMSSGSQR